VHGRQPRIAQRLSRSGVVGQDLDAGGQPATVADADQVGGHRVDQDPRGHVDVGADPKAYFDESFNVDLASQPLPQPLHFSQRSPNLGEVGDLHAVVSVTDRLLEQAAGPPVTRPTPILTRA
jgi:hypothetical protein